MNIGIAAKTELVSDGQWQASVMVRIGEMPLHLAGIGRTQEEAEAEVQKALVQLLTVNDNYRRVFERWGRFDWDAAGQP